MEIAGSVALITGGASGLGLGAARLLLERGASVALLDLPGSGGTDLLADLGPRARFVPADVTEPSQVERAFEATVAELGAVHICVNAAGVASASRVRTRDGHLFPLDVFKSTVAVNLVGTFDVVRRAADAMAQNVPNEDGERGVIVNVASIAAFEGQVGQAAYAASKGGVVAMTLPLARDLASDGIRVMTIAPGIMDTPMLAGMPDDLKASLAELHVFPKRLGTADDFAGLVEAIVSNPLLNGEVIRLDAATRMGPR